jgi:hypothetical protein
VALLQSLLGLAILALCGFAPGFYFVRRLRWTGVEKLCGSVALSLVLIWLAAWGVYVLAPGLEAVAYPAITLVCAGLLFAARRDAAALFRAVRVRSALVGFGFLLLWTLTLISIIRNYSAAAWSGDWLEHFQRSLFFLHHFPLRTDILGGYQLPARPPAMNVIAAFVLAQAGDRYEVFQAAFAFLNLLAFLPCCLMLPFLARPRRPGVLPLVAIFACSPVIMQNATYTWTKALPAFFVILAVPLYLKGWRRGDSLRMTAAFASLAMAFLAHYSAGPYLVFFALHYLLFVFWKRRTKWKELAWIGGTGAALLATWFAWSIAVYGAHTTFASNTSITASQQYQGSTLEKIAGNFYDSLVPRLARDPSLVNFFDQPNKWGQVRDVSFLVYQVNLIFCMGALGGFAVFWIFARTLRRKFGRPGERGFWIGLIVWMAVVGIAVVGERDGWGVAHLTLMPMAVLGMTLLASRFGKSRALKWVIVAGCVIDFSLGVFLQARIEHLEGEPAFQGLVFTRGQFQRGLVSEISLSGKAWENWMRKHQYRLAEEWGSGVEAFHPGDPAYDRAKAVARQRLAGMKAEDTTLWRGWYQRHGGETEFLGDHFGGGDETTAVLLLLFAGLMWKLVRAK